jgi:ribosomal peptide maturation radical SAM protein 1
MTEQHHSPLRLGLISMPWSLFNRPSIQLGALKAYMDTHMASSVSCTLFHPYLAVAKAMGSTTYHHLAKNSWAGEALYSPLLFPEQRHDAKKLFNTICRGHKELRNVGFDSSVQLLEEEMDTWLTKQDFAAYDLVGFSICFNQLLSSLYAAAQIKQRHPYLPIVFGGSGCVAEIGLSLLHTFSQIDYVVNGEGEEALAELCSHLITPAEPPLSPRIMTGKTKIVPPCSHGIQDLNELPAPDYSPYFKEMNSTFEGQPFVPVLPLEFSRGCWWNKCTFCNLNLQWHGYRWKRADTMLREVEQQSRNHQCLDFCFTDNALPPREADLFFDSLAEGDTDYDFFAEVRVLTDPDTPKRYRRGGLTTIQVGIEALSNSLLKKMSKGTRAIENIAAMRQSAEAGIQLDGNLIVEFPGSSPAEVQETLRNLDYVLPYPPLTAASFFLGHGSPVSLDPKSYGVTCLTQHPKNRQLFPANILQNLSMLIKGYRGDSGSQKKLWKEVRHKIAEWQLFHTSRESRHLPLSYRHGKNFLIIRQERMDGSILRHRLQGKSQKMYLMCRKITTLQELCSSFPKIPEPAIDKFLDDLCKKRLMFQEQDQFLALAIRDRQHSPFPSF